MASTVLALVLIVGWLQTRQLEKRIDRLEKILESHGIYEN